jgi:hypothetical protein
MRYYLINIYKNGTLFRTYTSFPNGQTDPGALNVHIDAFVNVMAAPIQNGAVVQIWGVPIADLSQASNFTNCTIQVFAGFQKGLPLNNPAQAGLILTGNIFQAFGNWTGTDQTLDFVVLGDGIVPAQGANFNFSWMAGTTLQSAMMTTLNNFLKSNDAGPNVKLNININPNLILAHDEHGVYSTMPAFAQMIKRLSAAAIGGNYPGVDICWTPTAINVFDGTTQSTPIQLQFQDLIGQPVWISPASIQFVCPMRADLLPQTYITMPKGLLGNPQNPAGAPGAVVTTAASQPQARQSSLFNGSFIIALVHHLGNFRGTNGSDWVTVFNAAIQPNAVVSPTRTESLAVAP